MSLAVWLGEGRKSSAAVVGLDLVFGLFIVLRYGGIHKSVFKVAYYSFSET